jgi:hypothetical protein
MLFRDAPGTSTATRREDYSPPPYWIDTVELSFDLDPAKTRVLNRMRLRRNTDLPGQPLRLDGDELNLARVLVNGAGTSFKMDGSQLVLENLPEGPEPIELEIFTTCAPAKNTKLMGLYVSNDSFFTQCEAEGFRRITYFLDRPDVMASYTVTLRADKAKYPVLLSNGNLVEQGDLDDGRHFAKWVDPHRKPAYLFALVAGVLVSREQRIVSRSGQEHTLQVYVRPGDLDKTEHAMNSLMASVAWDEARFGLPLDLERFMIVATSDFNMGAMENKGLNVFNTKYVLANPATATDTDYANIESVVGHEYFHNWTGNRVTCRDWFQLSLKEGLTVFRDQEFSQDMAGEASARAVRRIEDVRVLRTAQFPEDAGPMAHPVRPDQYLEISNFYTVTIYEKGAEVVRMMQTLVGREGFARGMKLYFERFDGQAVTCDDFAQAIADANPDSPLAAQLPQFKRWYSQAGTPHLRASGHHDRDARTYTLTFEQTCAPTPGQTDKQPFVIPVAMGLLQCRRTGASGLGAHPGPDAGQRNRGLRRRGYRARAVHPARVQCAGGAGLRLQRPPVADAAGPRHRPVQPLGSRPAPGPQARGALHPGPIQPAGGPGAGRRFHRCHARGAAPSGPGRRVQGAGADAAVGNLHLGAAGRRGPPAGACGARGHARTTGQRTGPRLAMGLGRAPGQRGLQPGHGFLRAACAGRPGLVHALPGRPPQRRRDLAWQGLPALQGCGQHDRPLQRPERAGRRRPCAGGRCTGALSRAVPGRSPGAGQMVCPPGWRTRPWW